MKNYTKEQIRNKIATLQKSEKIKGSPNYKALNLRHSLALKQRLKVNSSGSSKTRDGEMRQFQSPLLNQNLDVVTNMFLAVDPKEAFNGWFQLKVHSRVTLLFYLSKLHNVQLMNVLVFF